MEMQTFDFCQRNLSLPHIKCNPTDFEKVSLTHNLCNRTEKPESF